MATKNELEKFANRSRKLPKTVTVRGGDSWFRIAGDVFGDQRMAQMLANANPGVRGLTPGMVLKLPRAMRPGGTPNVSYGWMENQAGVAQGGRMAGIGYAPEQMMAAGVVPPGYVRNPDGTITSAGSVVRTAVSPVVGGGYIPQTAAYAPAVPTGMGYYPSPAPYVPAVPVPRAIPPAGGGGYVPASAPIQYRVPVTVPPVNQWPGYRGPRPAAAPRPTIQAPTIGALPPGWTRPPAVPAGAPVQYQPKVPGIRPTGGMTAPPPAGGGYVPATASTMQQPKRYPTVGGVAPGPKPGPGWTQNPTTGGWYPQFSSVTTQLIEQGIRPLVIQWNDPLLATADKPTDMELTAAGYLKDDYGNWINTVPTAQPAAAAAPGGGGGGGGGGGYGYGRGGGGGGGGGGSGISPVYARNAGRFGSTYAPGRAASGGRPGVARLGPAVTGVVSWRI